MTTAANSPSSSWRPASAQELLGEARSVSASPPVAFQILTMVRQADFSTDSLLKLVQVDPDLTAQLLRLVNSVEFRGHAVSSLQDAVFRLGSAEIADKALSLTMGRLLAMPKTDYCPDPDALWRHSVECALACRHLSGCRKANRWDAELAFTGGLLHDIGKIVINSAPAEALEVIAEVRREEGISGADAEFAVLGADHAEIGGLLLEQWNIPVEIARAVRYHHAPDFDPSGLANLLHIGNCCAKVHAGSRAWDDFRESLRPFALDQLGLTLAEVEEAWGEVLQDMDAIDRFMAR